MSYAYRPLHWEGLGHAFVNIQMYLDYDRQGFDVPIIPVQVNSYGSKIIRNRRAINGAGQEPDPISPTPRRCFEVGRITARILADSPWRVVIYASGGWSHGFLVEKHHCLWLRGRRDARAGTEGRRDRLRRDRGRLQLRQVPGGVEAVGEGTECGSSVLHDRQRQLRAPPDGVLHPLPQGLGRLRLLDLQPVVVVDNEDFRHEPHTHGVALAECAVHDHSHAVLLSRRLDRV
jgi:hypothetical protein